jgi:hypothetical protein
MASEDKQKTEQQSSRSTVVQKLTSQFNSWLKESNPDLHEKVEFTLDSMAQLADQGIDSAKATVDLLGEFGSELTGIESFRIIPKSSIALEVDIRCKQEQHIFVKQSLAPFVELRGLLLSKRIHFEALVNKGKKGLQLDINDGMSLMIDAPIIGTQTVPVKGSGLLMRDDRGQLILAVTATPPGLDTPVTVNIPLKHFASGLGSHIKKQFTRD